MTRWVLHWLIPYPKVMTALLPLVASSCHYSAQHTLATQWTSVDWMSEWMVFHKWLTSNTKSFIKMNFPKFFLFWFHLKAWYWFLDQGSNPHLLWWKHGVLTTGSPRNSLLNEKKNCFYIFNKFFHFYTVLIKETSPLLFLFIVFFINPTPFLLLFT